MKVVYILTCSKNDYYLEQLILSLRSLRIWNKDDFVEIVVDEQSFQFLSENNKLQSLSQADKVTCIFTPSKLNQMQKSRWLKTSLRNLIDDDFLFLDTDTVICGRLDFTPRDGDIYAVKDLHVNISSHAHKNDILTRASLIGWELKTLDQPYHNSGVLWVRDSPLTRTFYENWNRAWLCSLKAGCASDQPSLCKTNQEMGGIIKELDDSWNCQVVENGLKYLESAKIIHYFASGQKQSKHPFRLNDKEVYELLESVDEIPQSIMHYLKKPKSAFHEITQILADEDVMFYNSPLCRRLRTFYYNHNRFYNFIIKFVRKFKNF